ncbi:MAG TPA: glycoside hydrolase family 2 TIM barrel-domain containing protein [Bacilli bacterium]|nr:glycoside hydrolase family 2 TIM barrel-domain containing protein [Bacilli bacterium]
MLRSEYPRPDFVRPLWKSLNGPWSFTFDDAHVGHEQNFTAGNKFKRTIIVPFAFQTSLSGINEQDFHDHLWYQRTFKVPVAMRKKRVILHFNAVDYYSEVYLNGELVGKHEGGQTGFSFDITKFLTYKTERLVVYAFDPSTDEYIPRGKQYWKEKPESIWYNRTSGIWQSVWLEAVEENYVHDVFFTPDYDAGMIEIKLKVSDANIVPTLVVDKRRVKLEFTKVDENTLVAHYHALKTNRDYKTKSWSPSNPYLFDVQIKYGKDVVTTYFGMRKISTEGGKVLLNNEPYYMKLVLDQGYFKDGLLTAPSIGDLLKDIELAKAMGFNGARKHQKVEDKYYMYFADKIGFLVWGEMASTVKFNQESARRTMNEWKSVLPRDYNHPSIVCWVPLNESWGVWEISKDKAQQEHSLDLYNYIRNYDKTRLVVTNDGWEMTLTDICAIHNYRHGNIDDLATQEKFRYDISTKERLLASTPADRPIYVPGYKHRGEPILLTEFGGISYAIDQDGWGYSAVKSGATLVKEYKRIMQDIKNSSALAGYCYTQLTDVEVEINGLLTYTRQPKVSLMAIRRINEMIKERY